MAEEYKSGVKKNRDINGFASRWGTPKENNRKARRQERRSNILEVLRGIGLVPTVRSSSKPGHYHRGHCSGDCFRDSYRVPTAPSPTPQRTHEDRVREHMAFDAYMDLVDGKGDDER